MSAIQQMLFGGGGATAPGQACFVNTGTACYTWTVPAGVTKITVLMIGAGGYGANAEKYFCYYCCPCSGPVGFTINIGGGGGGGGASGWQNNYGVTPGTQYKIKFTAPSTSATSTVFANNDCSLLFSVRNGNTASYRCGGAGGSYSQSSISNVFSGGTGGLGCRQCVIGGNYYAVGGAGGGAAGGWSGTGAAGGNACLAGTSGSSTASAGGGGGGQSGSKGGGGAGGQNSWGNTSGSAGAAGAANGGGGGGAYGANAGTTATTLSGGAGAAYGGGGGGGSRSVSTCGSGAIGGQAIVRILWPGCARSYPGTRTANE